MAESGARRERRTKTALNGETIYEAGRDARFVSSPSDTVHVREELPGDEEGYKLDPKCGQTLPPGSLWGHVDADSVEEIVETYYHLKFCSKCFDRAYDLNRQRREKL